MDKWNDKKPKDFLFKIENREFTCPVILTMDTIGGKWKILILWQLFNEGIVRYSHFKRYLWKVTDKMLTQSLRELEADKLIKRHVYNTIPPHVEYSISDNGKDLEPIIRSMFAFGSKYKIPPK